MTITNKTVLITGANRGVGKALVNEALRRGAKSVYAGTRSSLEISHERLTLLMLDVTNSEQIQRAVGCVGPLDMPINKAGVDLHDDLSDQNQGNKTTLSKCWLESRAVSQSRSPIVIRHSSDAEQVEWLSWSNHNCPQD